MPCKQIRRADQNSCWLAVLPLLALCVAVLPGCDSDNKEGPIAAKPTVATEPRLVFRLALELKPETKIWDASRLLKEELEKASPDGSIAAGEIHVEFYDRGSIGTERQLLEACYLGVLEVVQINSSVVTTVEPYYSLLDLPYVFVSERHHEAVLNGPIGNELLDKLQDHGLQGLSFYCAGFRNMFYRRQADDCAETPAGLEGLKIRVMESPVMIESINAIGPTATPIPFSELYQSLRTGVVDGAENSGTVFVSSKYYETGCDCFTLTEHFTNQHVMVANRAWLESLPTRYSNRIRDVARDIVPAFNGIWDKANAGAEEEMRSVGVTVNRVSEKHEFLDRVRPIAAKFFGTHPHVSRELYDRILSEAEPSP